MTDQQPERPAEPAGQHKQAWLRFLDKHVLSVLRTLQREFERWPAINPGSRDLNK